MHSALLGWFRVVVLVAFVAATWIALPLILACVAIIGALVMARKLVRWERPTLLKPWRRELRGITVRSYRPPLCTPTGLIIAPGALVRRPEIVTHIAAPNDRIIAHALIEISR